MTPEQLRLVGEAKDPILADRDRFAASFYRRLFDLAPQTRALFPADLEEQKGKLVDELAFLVEAARDLDRFLGEARQLGARHHRYGVRPSDFGPLGAALFGALAEILGARWTPDMDTAWRRLFSLVAEAMHEGARESFFARTP